MYGVRTTALCGIQNAVDAQIRLAGRRWPNPVSLVGFQHVQGSTICVRIDSDCHKPQLMAGTNDTHGNLAAIRYQEFLKHRNVKMGLASVATHNFSGQKDTPPSRRG